jgi:hypothetical protein
MVGNAVRRVFASVIAAETLLSEAYRVASVTASDNYEPPRMQRQNQRPNTLAGFFQHFPLDRMFQ